MTSKPAQRTISSTPPKRRQTRSRAELDREARARAARQVNLQWAAVIIIGIVLLGLLLVFGNGSGGNVHSGQVAGHG